MKKTPHVIDVTSRREFLTRAGSGFGALALAYMLAEERGVAAALDAGADPTQQPHHPPRARSVIWLFMEGGPSHLDLFDRKPTLEKLAGQPLPAAFGRPITAMGTAGNTIMPSKRTWKQYGQSGLWVSDWYQEIAQHADELAMFQSCWADGLNHVGSVCQMNTGSILAGRPSMGAWVTYGLGTANQNLPTFVILTDAGEVLGGPKNWSAGFLPASYQGTLLRREGTPIFHLTPPETVGDEQQRSKLDFLASLNRRFNAANAGDSELDARLQSYELAYRMQAAAPEAIDLTKESDATRALYGMDEPETVKFGSNCLLARRFVERRFRFIQLYSGSGSGWDAHENIEANHSKMCKQTDRPIAGLLADLKARGLLDSTLVVWRVIERALAYRRRHARLTATAGTGGLRACATSPAVLVAQPFTCFV